MFGGGLIDSIWDGILLEVLGWILENCCGLLEDLSGLFAHLTGLLELLEDVRNRFHFSIIITISF